MTIVRSRIDNILTASDDKNSFSRFNNRPIALAASIKVAALVP